MNDRHPSGTMTSPAPASDASAAHYAPYGAPEVPYADLTTYSGYDATGFAVGTGQTGAFDAYYGVQTAGAQTGGYDTTAWHPGYDHDPYATQHHAVADTGAYETTAWQVPAQATGHDVSGQWDASAWLQTDGAAGHDPAQQWDWNAQTYDTGAYDATQWNSDGAASGHHEYQEHPAPYDPQDAVPFEAQDHAPYDQTAAFEHLDDDTHSPYGDATAIEEFGETALPEEESDSTGELPVVPDLLEDQEETVPAPRAGGRAANRSRRRSPAKRSALLTVAVPSVCVMGVAGIAAASVGNLTGDSQETSATASEAHTVQPAVANSELDSRLKTLSAGVDDFTDRASRTQERIDLKAQKAEEKRKAAAEAALKERLRPKFLLPVAQKGLSAYYGQAGVNWMSLHTGIDFPVAYGTTVMAATDGVVSTKWNNAYGNMMIITAKDGTETWYCHLSSYRVASGTAVKAGDPVAFSGKSGNSTGPHLHFEVRPGGSAAIDPLPWLRSHGLDPT
ncbi:M23 family metallopeptidase [Streptomyces sp. NPDC059575]|uniref:M23 family metallopeptidase n=1 Tax=Streptomyces sp. NPDC059575 TaxID=3346872 RepID=UPI0036B8C9CF